MKTTINPESLLDGYFGHIAQNLTLADGSQLVEIHIADTSDGWECGEWHLNGERICLCDGYNGCKWEDGYTPTEEIEELVTSYQISGLLEEAIAARMADAEEGDTNVRILVTREFYNDDFASRPRIQLDEDQEEWIFENYEAAQEWIDEQDAEIYRTSHNEAGRPSYRIVR